MRKIVSAIVIISILFILSCKQYNDDLEEFLSYWATQVTVRDWHIESPAQTDKDGFQCVSSGENASVTLTLQNPKKIMLVMPSSSETRKIVTFGKLGGTEPVVGTDYTLEQTASDRLRFTFKKEFLQRYEWGTQELHPELTLYAADGRKFSKPFSFGIKVNTPPPALNTGIIAKTKAASGSPAYYVICLSVPDMDESISGGLLHKDLASIEINGNPYPLKIHDGQTAFITPDGGDFLQYSDVEQLSEAVPLGKWVLYYKTDAEVKDGVPTKSYTIQLKDAKGFVSPACTAVTKQNKAETGDFTITPAATKGSGTETDPYIIALSDTQAQAEIRLTSPTQGTTVHCTRQSGGASQSFNGNPLVVPLPLDGNNDKSYTVEYYADGNGFIQTDKKTVYLKCAVLHTVTFNTQGGSTVDEQKIIHGEKAEEPSPAPVMTGYTIDGWYKDDTYSTQWDFIRDTVERDITLYAKWEPKGDTPYKVRHLKEKLSGGYDETIVDCFGTTGTNATVDLQNAAGFDAGTFAPANIEADGSTVIEVKYLRKTITVTFKPDGGTLDGSSSAATRTGKFESALPLPVAERTGYTFTGWNPSAPTTFPPDDTSYTAQWKANTYQVVFHGNGDNGGSMTNQSFTYDEPLKTLTANGFTKTGYTFQGWADSAGGATVKYRNRQEVQNLTSANDGTVDLYAVWKINEYKIEFGITPDKDGQNSDTGTIRATVGSGTPATTSPVTVTHGQTVTFTVSPAAGWEVESWTGADMDASNHNKATLTVTSQQTVTVNLRLKPVNSWAALKKAVSIAPSGSTVFVDGTVTANVSDKGQIRIDKDLTIKAKSGTATLDANSLCRIFYVRSGTVTLQNLTLKNGKSGERQSYGGGISIVEATVKLSNVTIEGCVADDHDLAGGGALYAQFGTVTLTDCTIRGNRAKNGGGGIYTGRASWTITGDTVIDNNTSGTNEGGGVYVKEGGSFTMQGNAKVNKNNDVYLDDDTKIAVDGALSQKPAARITPKSYTDGRVLAEGPGLAKENFTVTPKNGSEKWRTSKVGNQLKFKQGKLTVRFNFIKSITTHDNNSNGEYYWTIKVEEEVVDQISRDKHWSAGDNEKKYLDKEEIVTVSFAPRLVIIYIEIWEQDDPPGRDDRIGKIERGIEYNYANDSWTYNGKTIRLGGSETFNDEFRNSDGDVDVNYTISWSE